MLLIVVAIIGIIAAIAIPNHSQCAGNRLTSRPPSARFRTCAEGRPRLLMPTTTTRITATLIDSAVASGSAKSGYAYTSTGVSTSAFTVQATRSGAGSGDKDFNVVEDGVWCGLSRARLRPRLRLVQALRLAQLRAAKHHWLPVDERGGSRRGCPLFVFIGALWLLCLPALSGALTKTGFSSTRNCYSSPLSYPFTLPPDARIIAHSVV